MGLTGVPAPARLLTCAARGVLTIGLAVGLVCSVTVRVSAQRPPAPFRSISLQVHEVGDTTSDAGFLSMEDGNPAVTYRVYEDAEQVVELQDAASFDRPAGGFRLDEHFVVLGGFDSNTGRGVLDTWFLNRQPPYAMTKIATAVYADIDPIDVAWSAADDRVYLWSVDGALFAAPLFPGISLPARGDFSTPLTPVDLPALAAPASRSYDLWGRASGGVNLNPTAFRHRKGTTEFPRYRISFVPGSGWNITAWSSRSVAATTLQALGYAIRHANHVPTVGPLLLKGPGGDFDVVHRQTDAVVHTGQLPTVSQWWLTDDDDRSTWEAVMFAPGTLEPGEQYFVRGPDGQTSRFFLPLIRYGDTEEYTALIGGTRWRMQRGQANGWAAVVGNDRFLVTGQLGAEPAGAGARVDFYLNVGFRRPDGTDPVLLVGGQHILHDVAATAGPVIVAGFEGDELRWPLAHTVPIPEDPDLAGQVVLFQHLALTGGEVLASDVFGIRLSSAPSMATAGGGRQDDVAKALANWSAELEAGYRRAKERIPRASLLQALIASLRSRD